MKNITEKDREIILHNALKAMDAAIKVGANGKFESSTVMIPLEDGRSLIMNSQIVFQIGELEDAE